jgi:hypothetical protein
MFLTCRCGFGSQRSSRKRCLHRLARRLRDTVALLLVEERIEHSCDGRAGDPRGSRLLLDRGLFLGIQILSHRTRRNQIGNRCKEGKDKAKRSRKIQNQQENQSLSNRIVQNCLYKSRRGVREKGYLRNQAHQSNNLCLGKLHLLNTLLIFLCVFTSGMNTQYSSLEEVWGTSFPKKTPMSSKSHVNTPPRDPEREGRIFPTPVHRTAAAVQKHRKTIDDLSTTLPIVKTDEEATSNFAPARVQGTKEHFTSTKSGYSNP